MPPEEFPSVLAMKTGTVVSDREVGVVKEDGTTIWVSVSAAPLPVRGLGAAVVTWMLPNTRMPRWLWKGNDEPWNTCCEPATTNGN